MKIDGKEIVTAFDNPNARFYNISVLSQRVRNLDWNPMDALKAWAHNLPYYQSQYIRMPDMFVAMDKHWRRHAPDDIN